MNCLKQIAYFICVVLLIGCLKKSEFEDEPAIYEETIDISNYKEVLFNGNLLKIGTSRYHYIRGEIIQLYIMGPPT